MKIRIKKEFNLAEMIQYIMENEDCKGQNYSPRKQEGRVKISYSGDVYVDDILATDTFIVEVEEELTEDTHLGNMVEVRFDDNVIYYRDIAISDIKGSQTSRIYVVSNGEFNLIWSHESGIPADDILEF